MPCVATALPQAEFSFGLLSVASANRHQADILTSVSTNDILITGFRIVYSSTLKLNH